MARTRRVRIRTPTPFSSEERTLLPEESLVEESPSPQSPPRSHRKTASTSCDEPPLDYDTTRFTSLDNQQWYETGLDKEIISVGTRGGRPLQDLHGIQVTWMGGYFTVAQTLLSQSGLRILRQCRREIEPQWQPHRLLGSRKESGSHSG